MGPEFATEMDILENDFLPKTNFIKLLKFNYHLVSTNMHRPESMVSSPFFLI